MKRSTAFSATTTVRSNNQKKPPFLVVLSVLGVLRGRFLLDRRYGLLLLRQISHCPEPRDTLTERRMSCHEIRHFSLAVTPHRMKWINDAELCRALGDHFGNDR